MGHLKLTGVSGVVEGEEATIAAGEEITIGRSRASGVSLRRARKWAATGKAENQADREFRSVSRTHARIRVLSEDRVEVEGMGRNGTYVDGVRIDRLVLTDLAKKKHEVRLGPREAFRLEWVDA